MEFGQFDFDAYLMLFPTRTDPLGLVVCKVSACGLPILATDTVGVRGALNDGVIGFAMPHEARGDAYAANIM